MKTLVLFDIGRVLVTLDHERFYRQLGRASGLPLEQVKQQLIGTGYDEELDIGNDAGYRSIISHALKLPFEVKDGFLDDAYLLLHTGPNKPVVDLKKRLLDNVAVGLLSNSHQRVRDYVERCWPGTLQKNSLSVFSDHVKSLKPAHPMYDAIARTAERIIFIDDQPKNLVYPATSLGWRCIRYSEFLPDAPVPDTLRKDPFYSEARNATELEQRVREAGVLLR